MIDVKAIRAYVHIDTDREISVYTGNIVKTLVYAFTEEVKVYHGVRGIVSPIHISPLFTPGKKEGELGDLITPTFVITENGSEVVRPVKLGGEYMFHVGGEAGLVEKVTESLNKNIETPLKIKYKDSILTFKLEKVLDVTEEIMSKSVDDKVTLYLKAPVRLFNVFAPSRLPKFNVSSVEMLYVPFLFHIGSLTVSSSQLPVAGRLLGLLIETYYSNNSVRSIKVPLKPGKPHPGMVGKVTYIVDIDDPSVRQILSTILSLGEIVGLGESRTEGFGTVVYRN